MAELRLDGPGVPLLVSAPEGAGPGTRVLVSIHGISRNAREHLDSFASAAEGRCAVVAPRFDEGRFPRYQTLGLGRDEPRADLALLAALDGLAERTGLGAGRIDLFGFSGGAQFAHRFAMLHPRRLRSLQVSSAGHYTFFDEATTWPRGLRRCPARAQAAVARRFFLRLPIRVYVGERDLARDPGLRSGEKIDAQQGLTRVARAEAWTRHVAALQQAAGFPPARLEILARCGHDYADAAGAGELPRRVLAACGLAVPPRPASPQPERTSLCDISGGSSPA